ncbi:PAS domain-containing protein [Breoghania sp. L-A4]|uniref:PAS domain-containing protein n=1 Tax=Breoghania sp. L-A4 TaxID=2304600 RepID=UPI0013C29F4E|nr:PAS domain-containing protein [Breoghania sp. L-A4]
MAVAFAGAIACVALVGWMLAIPVLTSLRADLASTSVPTAIGLLLGCFSVWWITSSGALRTQRPGVPADTLNWLERVPSIVIGLTAVYVIARYAVGDPLAGELFGPTLGRVALATAISFLLFSIALLTLDFGRGGVGVTSASLGLVVTGIDLTGHVYDVQALYQVMPFTVMAVPTSLGLAALFVALLLARPDRGWLRYAFRDDDIGGVFRLVLPAVAIVPPLLAFAAMRAMESGLFEPSFGFAVLAVVTTVVLTTVVCSATAWMSHVHAALRETREALLENAQLLEVAMDIAHIGAWSASIAQDAPDASHVDLSTEAYGIFGLEKDAFDGRFDTVLALVHSGDRDVVMDANKAAFDRKRGEEPASVNYRIIRPDGEERWLRQQVRVLHDSGGQPLRIIGVVQDMTNARLVDRRLAQAQKMEAIGSLTGVWRMISITCSPSL